MAIKCPKCHSANPETKQFCADCGTQLPPPHSHPPVVTETLQTPIRELTTGSMFAGRYQVIEELGHGGMGRVYRVLDQKLDEEVALKLIKPEIAADKETIKRFHNELRLARKIAHRNVGKMYELMEDRGTHFITMEYVPGQDLKGLIRQMGQLTAGKAVSIAKQICEGLEEAHRLGVVHRDLKPGNILIDKDGNARITDFGIARSLSGKGITGAGVMIGTPEYMSPEQVEGKDVDQRSDIYSLGIILYEMLTARVPFEGDTPFTIGVKHKSEIPRDPRELNTQIPPDLDRHLLKCLEKDKTKRYQSVGDLLADLEKAEQGLPTTEHVVAKRKAASREITVILPSKRILIPSLAAAALIVAAVILWLLVPKEEAVLAARKENSVAVISFENLTGDPRHDGLIRAVPSLMITKFEAMGIPYVATWERLQDLVKQMGRDPGLPVDKDTGFEVCRREGIAVLVTGEVTKAGDVFVTNIKALDAGTKRSLASASSKGRGEESLFAQIDDLAGRLYRDLDWTSAQTAEAAPVAQLTTASMEAYQHFLMGSEYHRKVYMREAAEEFEKAVAIDPGFALAYFYLTSAYGSLGRWSDAAESIKKAEQHSSKATEKERLLIEAGHALMVENDMNRGVLILQDLGQRYPKEKYCHVMLSQIYYMSGDYQKTVEVARKALALDPEHGEAHMMAGFASARLKDYDRAVFHLEKYIALNPRDPNPQDCLGDAYFLMGRPDDALAGYTKAITIEPGFYVTYPKIAYLYALKEDYPKALEWIDKCLAGSSSSGDKLTGHRWKAFYSYWLGSAGRSLGHLQKAHEIVATQAGELFGIAAGNAQMVVEDQLRALFCYHLGKLELSRQANDAWFARASKAFPQDLKKLQTEHGLIAGWVDLKENDSPSARARLAEVRSLIPSIEPPANQEVCRMMSDGLEAEILFQEKKFGGAIAVIDRLPRPGPPSLPDDPEAFVDNLSADDLKARALEAQGDLDRAIAEYERLTTLGAGGRGFLLIDPRFHYRLARLYEQKGLKAKAQERYRRFLTLWKDADPGLPEVEDAKRRLAGLKGS